MIASGLSFFNKLYFMADQANLRIDALFLQKGERLTDDPLSKCVMLGLVES